MPKQVDNYLIDRHVRKGTYGELWRGRDVNSGEAVALRVVRRSAAAEMQRLRREVQILRRLSHGNIVRLLDLKKTPARFYLVLEFCPGGDLAHFLRMRGRVAEDVAWHFLVQIASGLHALHLEVATPHGDLRPGNILLSAEGVHRPGLPTLKLANFGHGGSALASPYAAPEVLRGELLGVEADLWSLGVIAHELLVGKPLRRAAGAEADRPPELNRDVGCSQAAGEGRCLVSALLSWLPSERPSSGEALRRLAEGHRVVSSRAAADGCDAADFAAEPARWTAPQAQSDSWVASPRGLAARAPALATIPEVAFEDTEMPVMLLARRPTCCPEAPT